MIVSSEVSGTCSSTLTNTDLISNLIESLKLTSVRKQPSVLPPNCVYRAETVTSSPVRPLVSAACPVRFTNGPVVMPSMSESDFGRCLCTCRTVYYCLGSDYRHAVSPSPTRLFYGHTPGIAVAVLVSLTELYAKAWEQR
ncbi:hypothetical protein BaRGS_00025622 [Batillaria attramentaria]|uniref:Uncharacterized protein n=1 Tax=Batillaria attramentaria TaxID=370345 RepID=A0ABD0K717_9CAEN